LAAALERNSPVQLESMLSGLARYTSQTIRHHYGMVNKFGRLMGLDIKKIM
jgi:hypothetical protein